MRLSITTEAGQLLTIDVDAQMELENVKALLEADTNIQVANQRLYHNGKELTDSSTTLEAYGVKHDDIILLRGEPSNAAPTTNTSHAAGSENTMSSGDAESMRLMVLGNPQLMNQLRTHQPQLADAVQNPVEWRGVAQGFARWQRQVQQEREAAAMNADPYDLESQQRIEEAIRMERVMENLETALEFNPEAFGRVTMLYIDVEVNGRPVKAFVDSGAQATIMSPECAERCGIMRLVDRRFSGIAKGVGTAKILGRVHAAQIKLGTDLFLMCSFTIMENRGVELLFGLDLLRRHQMIIDLSKNCLTVQDRSIRFLDEHELPEDARVEEVIQGEALPPGEGVASQSGAQSVSQTGKFPGSGQALGTNANATGSSSSGNSGNPSSNPRAPPATRDFPESDISSLMSLGVSRQEAIQALTAAGGNMEVAAAMLFG